MNPLVQLVMKELLLLRRDWHALLLLFVMPTLFIVIMSLALRDTFASHGPRALTYYLINLDGEAAAGNIVSRLEANPNFRALNGEGVEDELSELVKAGKAHFLIVIPKGFSAKFQKSGAPPVELKAGPGVEPTAFKLFEAAVKEAVSKVYLKVAADDLGLSDFNVDGVEKLVEAKSLYEEGGRKLPSSVQQNVPAWLVFAMFFIAIPLSTTWVQEKSLGTMARLKTMGVAPTYLILGKLLPYLLVNLIQVALMLSVGVFLVPRLGGERLDLGSSPEALALMAVSLSMASVSFGLLIANLVKSSEQATIFTGVSNLVLAVLGGIMVPRFVMPLFMQKISLLSPLSWGLEGFLDIFLRGYGVAGVIPWATKLCVFALACLISASFLLGRARAK